MSIYPQPPGNCQLLLYDLMGKTLWVPWVGRDFEKTLWVLCAVQAFNIQGTDLVNDVPQGAVFVPLQ